MLLRISLYFVGNGPRAVPPIEPTPGKQGEDPPVCLHQWLGRGKQI